MKTFLYRRRKQAKDSLAALGDLRGRMILIEATDGTTVDMRFVTKYSFQIDHWSAKVSISMTTEAGEFKAKIPNLQEFVRLTQSSM